MFWHGRCFCLEPDAIGRHEITPEDSMKVHLFHTRRALLGMLSVLLLGTALLSGTATAATSISAKKKSQPKVEKPAPVEGVININEATVGQLRLLPGIGLKKAERIRSYRTRRPFRRVYQLMRVKGIGAKTVRKLRRWLRVKGPTTLVRPLRGRR